MKLETVLDAMEQAENERVCGDEPTKRLRQYNAFRNRILRMYRKRDEQASKSFELWCIERGITQDKQRIIDDQKQRIAELEALIDEVVALDPLFPDELMDRLKGVE